MATKTCSRCKQRKTEDQFEGKKCCLSCREYNKATRHRYKGHRKDPKRRTGRLPTVVCGRKFCCDCKRWRHLMDFGVATYNDPITRDFPVYYRSFCHHCERLRGRVKNARLAGRDRPYGQRQPGLKGREKLERWKEMERKRRQDPEYLEKRREYQRIWAEGKRREAGITPRQAMIDKRHAGPAPQFDEKVPIAPFQQWVRERSEALAREHGTYFVTGKEAAPGLALLGEICGLTARTLSRYLSGREGDRVLTEVPLSTVEDCLTREGTTMLWELYPEVDGNGLHELYAQEDDQELLAA